MLNFDYITREDTKEHNPNWPEILDHLYRILIVGGSGSGETKALLNRINHEQDIDKFYLYAKDLNLNDSKSFIVHSNDMDDIYKNIEEYNPNIFSHYLTGKDIMPSDERQVIEQACIFSS